MALLTWKRLPNQGLHLRELFLQVELGEVGFPFEPVELQDLSDQWPTFPEETIELGNPDCTLFLEA